MNKKILSIIGMSILPISIAFAQSNEIVEPTNEPANIQEQSPVKQDNTNNQTDGLPPSEMHVPNSGIPEPQQEEQLQPSSSTNSNVPTSASDINTQQFENQKKSDNEQ